MGVRIYATSILLIPQGRDARLASCQRGTDILPAPRCASLWAGPRRIVERFVWLLRCESETLPTRRARRPRYETSGHVTAEPAKRLRRRCARSVRLMLLRLSRPKPPSASPFSRRK
jgi:hypothetical protein